MTFLDFVGHKIGSLHLSPVFLFLEENINELRLQTHQEYHRWPSNEGYCCGELAPVPSTVVARIFFSIFHKAQFPNCPFANLQEDSIFMSHSQQHLHSEIFLTSFGFKMIFQKGHSLKALIWHSSRFWNTPFTLRSRCINTSPSGPRQSDSCSLVSIDSQNHRISWVGRDPQRSSNSTPGLTGSHKIQTLWVRAVFKHSWNYCSLKLCPLHWAVSAHARSDHAVQHQPSPANY